MLINLPYGRKSIKLEVEGVEVLSSKEATAVRSIDQELIKKLENPISAPNLRKLSEKAGKILLIIPDNTRAFPSRDIVPALIDYIDRASRRADIRILIATGLHMKVR